MNKAYELKTSPSGSHACNCIGPQAGKPLCPCRMKNLRVVDGRYVEVIDHGLAVKLSDMTRQLFDWERME